MPRAMGVLGAGLGLLIALVMLSFHVGRSQADVIPVPGPTITVTATPAPAPTVTITATPEPAPTVTVTARATPASRSQARSSWVEQVRACIVQRESRGDYRARNPSSTASGAYQFIDSTWRSVTGRSDSAWQAPRAVQDAAFYKLFANGAGRNHWYLAGGKQCW